MRLEKEIRKREEAEAAKIRAQLQENESGVFNDVGENDPEEVHGKQAEILWFTTHVIKMFTGSILSLPNGWSDATVASTESMFIFCILHAAIGYKAGVHSENDIAGEGTKLSSALTHFILNGNDFHPARKPYALMRTRGHLKQWVFPCCPHFLASGRMAVGNAGNVSRRQASRLSPTLFLMLWCRLRTLFARANMQIPGCCAKINFDGWLKGMRQDSYTRRADASSGANDTSAIICESRYARCNNGVFENCPRSHFDPSSIVD